MDDCRRDVSGLSGRWSLSAALGLWLAVADRSMQRPDGGAQEGVVSSCSIVSPASVFIVMGDASAALATATAEFDKWGTGKTESTREAAA